MSDKFILSCCSTVDLPYSYLESRHIPVLFYTYVVDGVTYDDDMGRDPQALPRFYQFIKEGKLPQTSQINEAEYEEFFESLLQQGDVLHIAFTSGQSGSVYNAFLAAEMLKEKYPDRKLVVLDSLCSSSGYGLLVDTVADMRDAGATQQGAPPVLLHRYDPVPAHRPGVRCGGGHRHGAEHLPADAAGQQGRYQGIRQGAGQAQSHRSDRGRHGGTRPGRPGV